MRVIGIALAASLAFGGAAYAQETGEAFGDKVRAYLLENPELLIEMQHALEVKQAEEAREAQALVLSEARDRIFENENDIVLGNPDGDVTIVEFFDYNCAFCRRAMDDMDAVIAADPDVRFVLKEFPILGPASLDAHVVSMAVAEVAPDKYDEFHRRLLNEVERADRDAAMLIANELGIDASALEGAMQGDAAAEAFGDAYELANALQITGTPSYVVGDEVMFGAVGADQLLQRIEALRAVDESSN